MTRSSRLSVIFFFVVVTVVVLLDRGSEAQLFAHYDEPDLAVSAIAYM